MNRNVISEIKKFRKLSGLLKENLSDYQELFNDLKKLSNISSDKMKKSEEYKDLMNFFKTILPSDFDINDGEYSDNTGDRDSSKIKSITTNDDDFYESILKCLDAPVTKDNILFFYAWRQAESGNAKNNPFNTTKNQEGATLYGKNKSGVKNYPTVQDGIKATCDTLKLPYYTDIVDGLKNDVGIYKLSRMSSLNTWGTKDLLADVVDGYLKGSTPKPSPISKGDFKSDI